MRSDLFWHPVVVSHPSESRNVLVEALRRRTHIPDSCLRCEYSQPESVIEWIQSQNANICFLDITDQQDRALELARKLADQDITVVALHAAGDADSMLRCLRAGVHEFLPEPFDGSSIWPVLDALSSRRLKNERKLPGSVHLVVPAKPSFGATTLAIGMGVRAARESSGSALLVDLDPLCGSVRFQLRTKGGSEFIRAFSDWARMDDDLWRQFTINYSGLDVLMAPETWVGSSFDAPAPIEFVNFLRQRYCRTFIDCPGLINRWYLDLASQVDDILLVTTNELTAIHATKRTLETLEALGDGSAKIKLIVNRYNPGIGVDLDTIESMLGRSIFQILPNDYAALQKAICDGKPVGPDSPLGRGLDQLWLRLLGRSQLRPPQGAWPSMLARLWRPGQKRTENVATS